MHLQIPLDIADVKLEKVDTSTTKGFVLTVSSTLKGATCQQCGKTIDKFYGYDKEITLRHLPIFESSVWLKIKPKRYQCPDCDKRPTTTQTCSWYDSKSPHTKAYKQKGHKDFVVIISAINEQGDKHLLAVLPDRKKDTVNAFLSSIPAPQKATIQRVCTDMYEGYSNAVYETLPHAIVIVDRFHVAKNYRACADKARKEAMRTLNETLSDQDTAELKGAMWVFRKRWQELTIAEQIILLTLFRHAPALKDVYIFREALTSIFNSPLTKAQAVDRLNAWMAQVQANGLICFNSFIKTLQKWMTEISHYFIQRQSSGFVEGLNNKIKVIKRRCYGIYNLGRLFQHIWLDVEGRRFFGYA